MKSHRHILTIHTQKHREYVNITSQVQSAIDQSGIQEGLALVNPMHITASCYINDDEAGLIQDFDDFLERIAPYDLKGYRHHQTGEDNGDSHLKRQLFGREVVVAITQGKLDLGADFLRGV